MPFKAEDAGDLEQDVAVGEAPDLAGEGNAVILVDTARLGGSSRHVDEKVEGVSTFSKLRWGAFDGQVPFFHPARTGCGEPEHQPIQLGVRQRELPVGEALGEPSRGRASTGLDAATNTHVISQAGRTFAVAEAGAPVFELTDDLDSVGPCDFDGTLPGAYSGHPQGDPATGELHAVSYYFGWGNRVQYTVVGTDARVRRTVDIEVGGSPMIKMS